MSTFILIKLFDFFRLYGKPDGSCERLVGTDVGDGTSTDSQQTPVKQSSNKTEPPGNYK